MLSLRFKLCFFAACVLSLASAQYTKTWSAYRDLGRYGNEQAFSLVRSPDGAYYGASTDHTGPVNLSDTLVRKFDSSGVLLWTRVIGGASQTRLLTNTSGVIAVTTQMTSGPCWILVTKYDASGSVIWATKIGGAFAVNASDTVMDVGGNVVIGGSCTIQGIGIDGLVAKVNGGTGAIMFQSKFGTAPLHDLARQVTTDSNGNIFVIGWSHDDLLPNAPNLFFIKYSPAGTLLWSKTLSAAQGDTVSVDTSGNSILVSTDQSTFTTSTIAKFDPNGNVVWSIPVGSFIPLAASTFASNGNMVLVWSTAAQTIEVRQVTPAGTILNVGSAPGQRPSEANGLMLDTLGNVFVAGTSPSTGNFGQPTLYKFNLNTGFVWSRAEVGTFGTNNLGINPSGIIVDPNGQIAFLTTVSNVSPTLLDTRLAAYDTNGNRFWGFDLDPSKTADIAAAGVTDATGNSYVVNYGVVSRLTRFDSAGHYVWSHTLSGLNIDGPPLAPQMSPNGSIIIPARKFGSVVGETGSLTVFDAAGNKLWTYSISSTTDSLQDYQVANDGSIYLCFERFVNSQGNARLLKLSSTGTVLWTVNDPSSWNAHVFHLAVDANGSAFINYGTSSSSYSVVKFNSAGSFVWRKSLAGPSFITAGQIKLDGAGNLVSLVSEYLAGPVEFAIKLDTDGNVLWTAPVNIVWASNADTPLAIDSAGNIFISAWSPSKARVEKISASGDVAWTSDYAVAFAPGILPKLLPDEAGGVLALVAVEGSNGFDYCLFRMASDGSLPWPTSGGVFVGHGIRYDSRHLDDIPASLTRDAAGNLYIIGSSSGSSNTADVNVVKYAPSP